MTFMLDASVPEAEEQGFRLSVARRRHRNDGVDPNTPTANIF